MEIKKRSLWCIIFGRTTVIILMLLIQILILLSWVQWLQEFSIFIYGAFTALSLAAAIAIINERGDPSFKLVWIIPVLVMPVFGTLLYLYARFDIGARAVQKRVAQMIEESRPYLEQEKEVYETLKKEDTRMGNLSRYISCLGGYPTYRNTRVTYFPLGEDKFEELKRQLEAAKEFIFLEYFIIEEGLMWNTVLDILKRKVQEGVEVRVMYDGMCALALLPYQYPKELEKYGIKCKMFHPIKPALSTHQNNRDHRKILVIDGKAAFTGGVNLADEYINRKVKYGHWKDIAVMLEGEAVDGFTIMFLQMWNVYEKNTGGYETYIHKARGPQKNGEGFVIPFGDSPMDGENVGERVYMDILNTATDYVHIMTPYLILDYEMITALTFAAKSGVDVKIIMPHIPDKKIAFAIARTYYPELLEGGVKIYEYTPGFVHAKCFVSDDAKAVIGTINLDYRSLFLHFECAALLYQNPEIAAVEADFQNTLKKCQEFTLEDYQKTSLLTRLQGRIFRFFGPLM